MKCRRWEGGKSILGAQSDKAFACFYQFMQNLTYGKQEKIVFKSPINIQDRKKKKAKKRTGMPASTTPLGFNSRVAQNGYMSFQEPGPVSRKVSTVAARVSRHRVPVTHRKIPASPTEFPAPLAQPVGPYIQNHGFQSYYPPQRSQTPG